VAGHPRDPDEVTAGIRCLLNANTLSLGSQPGMWRRAGLGLWTVDLPITLYKDVCMFIHIQVCTVAHVCLGLSLSFWGLLICLTLGISELGTCLPGVLCLSCQFVSVFISVNVHGPSR
jgi:hypothetical protein